MRVRRTLRGRDIVCPLGADDTFSELLSSLRGNTTLEPLSPELSRQISLQIPDFFRAALSHCGERYRSRGSEILWAIASTIMEVIS